MENYEIYSHAVSTSKISVNKLLTCQIGHSTGHLHSKANQLKDCKLLKGNVKYYNNIKTDPTSDLHCGVSL